MLNNALVNDFRFGCSNLKLNKQRLNPADNRRIDLFKPADTQIDPAYAPIVDKRAALSGSPKPMAKPDTVQHLKQNTSVKRDSGLSLDDFEQLHFGVTITHQSQAKRATVMLEGYWIKALQRKQGLTNNTAIRAWIEQAINSDGGKFDSSAPLTRQVKRMIIESFV